MQAVKTDTELVIPLRQEAQLQPGVQPAKMGIEIKMKISQIAEGLIAHHQVREIQITTKAIALT